MVLKTKKYHAHHYACGTLKTEAFTGWISGSNQSVIRYCLNDRPNAKFVTIHGSS